MGEVPVERSHLLAEAAAYPPDVKKVVVGVALPFGARTVALVFVVVRML